MKFRCDTLTTCEVVDGGEGITLNLTDGAGVALTLEVSFEHAQAIAMTLPHLLNRAVKQITGDPGARYVFSLGDWRIEESAQHDGLILTMATPDGFEVAFGVPSTQLQPLGWTLSSRRRTEPNVMDGPRRKPRLHTLN